MGFYEETLLPMIKKTVAVIEKTPHMQDILHGTMPDDRFRFQIKQNYNYLMEFTKCWAVGFAKCNGYEEMKIWYDLLTETMHDRSYSSLSSVYMLLTRKPSWLRASRHTLPSSVREHGKEILQHRLWHCSLVRFFTCSLDWI